MAMDRLELGTPLNVGVVDLNGPAAFAHYGLAVRDYPGLIPSLDTAVALAGEPLLLRPWQNTLHFHAELAVIVGRDVAAGEGAPAEDALLGYCLGLGIWDDAAVADLRNRVVRDVGVNTTYGYLIDGSRQQGRTILEPHELPPLDQLVLTLHVPGRPPAVFHQRDLISNGRRVLRECSKLVGFCRGDVICLGPSAAPVVVKAEERFPAGAVIRVEGPPFAAIEVPIVDERNPEGGQRWPGCAVDFVSRYPHLRG